MSALDFGPAFGRNAAMSTDTNIVLVGFMGTGKTTVGRIVAERRGMSFVDMDDVIVEREGKPIPRIFAEDGEPHFRACERRLVLELAARQGLVIATGGGIVLNPDNVADFSRTGLVVCLWAEPEEILRRVGADTNRPLLAVADKIGRIRELLAKRAPLYRTVPNQLDTTGLDSEAVVNRILQLHDARQRH
jgi:shikimate kinase